MPRFHPPPPSDPSWVDVIQAVAWPLTAISLALLLISPWGQAFMKLLLGRMRKVSAFGVTVELSADAASKFKARIEDVFRDYRREIRAEFDRQAHIAQIDQLRRTLIDDLLKDGMLLADRQRAQLRSTLYVPDVLFSEALYQLLDYYPGERRRASRGRAFSMRFGMIGLAWRSQEPKLALTVSPDPADLVREWAMLPEEAEEAGQGRSSFVAVPIRHEGLLVGLFYADAHPPNAFVADILTRIETKVAGSALPSTLAQVGRHLRARGPALEIYDA